jgi:transposase
VFVFGIRLTGLRTQAICQLHALLCSLIPGGASRLLSAERAGQILRTVRPAIPVEVERKRVALGLLGDVRRVDNQLVASNERIVEAVLAYGHHRDRHPRDRPAGRRGHVGPHRRR